MRIAVVVSGWNHAPIHPDGTYDLSSDERFEFGSLVLVLDDDAELTRRSSLRASHGMVVIVRGALRFVYSIPFRHSHWSTL